ncbi:MAG: 50S ribosomal protein L25/general stress protein Ctc [Pseudomonadales bacterium]|nr:50S ribosomal protein L25/general stress protein Ctc [Pseudomonadales bacterium]
MADSIVINAERRKLMGKAASRRLRKKEDKVPGILYGGSDDPIPLVVHYKDLLKAMQDESFFSQILEVSLGKKSQQAVVRDLQRNPASEKVTHIDFLRVQADREINVAIPLRFLNEEECPGVKVDGGSVTHNLTEIEVSCLPANLPEFLEIDMADLEIGDSIKLSDLTVPKDVVIVALASADEDRDVQVASVIAPRLETEEELDVVDEDALAASGEEGSATSDSPESGVDEADSASDESAGDSDPE